MTTIIPTNEYQTPITQEWLDGFPSEVQEQFLDYMDTVPLLKWMVGERPRAKDLERDENGRIKVDIVHPHILEDMDYFRPAVKFYQENGCYTFLKPNSNPKSEFRKWFDEEVRRCRDGYVRESDGEWVTGLMYFFLNYCPIMVSEKSKKTGIVHRVEGFPVMWEGIYYRFHYLDQARKRGKHCIELARRGAGKSYGFAGLMAHNLLLGEDLEATKNVTTVLTAYTKEYLSQKDGTFTKFTPMIDFCAANTEFPRLMLTRRSSDMLWRMGYKNSNGNEMGSLNSVMGLSVKDDEGKIRGKRGFILFEEMGNYVNFKDVWDNVRDSVKNGEDVFSLLYALGTAGDDESDFAGIRTILYKPDAYEVYSLENVYDRRGKGADKFAYFFPSYISREGCMDKDGNSDVVKALMQILMERYMVKQGGDPASLLKRIAQMPVTPEEAILRVSSTFFPTVMLNERIRQLDSSPHIYDDIYVGELVEVAGKVTFKSTHDFPIREYPVPNTERGALEIYSMPPSGNIPYNRFCIGCLTPGQKVNTDSGLKNVEDVTLDDKLVNKDGEFVPIVNLQRRLKEDSPVYSIKLWDIYDRKELTGNHPVYAATPEKHYHHWTTHLKTGEPAVYYKYDFAFRRADELKPGDVVKSPVLYREERPIPYSLWDDIIKRHRGEKIFSNPLGNWKFWWLVGLVLGDGYCRKYTISVSFNKKETQYISRFKSAVSEVFGRSIVIGHERGNCVELQFTCRRFSEFFTKWFGKYADGKYISEWVKYLPKWLKIGLITGYLDSDGCCCKNSMEFVSVSKRLLQDVQDILLSIGVISGLKKLRSEGLHVFGEKNPSKTKITYSLAIARAGVEKLSRLLGRKDYKFTKFDFRKTASHSSRRVWLSDDENYVFYKIHDITIIDYTGWVYNFECDTHTYMCNGLPVHNCDPVDNDKAESQSLMSVFVFDLFNDEIVAEYTGRQQLAEDGYEIVRLLALFYNATIMYESNRKLMFSYFSKKRCLYMLADCPEWIRQKGLVKYNMFGSSIKGVSVNAALISTGIDLIKDWLLKTKPVEVKDETGQIHIEHIPQLYDIRNRALLQELVSYAPEKNTDRVSALFQVMFYREQYNILYGGADSEQASSTDDADDEFFNQDWESYTNRHGERNQLTLGL